MLLIIKAPPQHTQARAIPSIPLASHGLPSACPHSHSNCSFSGYDALMAVKRAYDPCNLFTQDFGLGSGGWVSEREG